MQHGLLRGYLEARREADPTGRLHFPLQAEGDLERKIPHPRDTETRLKRNGLRGGVYIRSVLQPNSRAASGYGILLLLNFSGHAGSDSDLGES